jgi:hypothetical protein
MVVTSELITFFGRYRSLFKPVRDIISRSKVRCLRNGPVLPSSCFPPFALACRVLRAAVIALLVSRLALGQSYTINTLAGGVPDNVPATSVGIGEVTGVALDSAGNLFVASTANVVSVVMRSRVCLLP